MIKSLRLLKILCVLLSHRLDRLLESTQLPLLLRIILMFHPWRLLPSDNKSDGERLRLALIKLGPIFVKFGQLLSTRRDLLPEDIADELALLQDQVPPFAPEQAKAIIEQSMGSSIEEVFTEFDANALASASIAQIHTASLHSGESVVIKVVRPGIKAIIEQDIALLYSIAEFIEQRINDGHRLRPVEIIEDYEHTILDELNLLKEAANTAQLRRNFEGSDLLYVPQVHWDYCRQNVMVMERIHGIPVTDLEQLKKNGTNMKALAERGVEIFFTQLLRDNFFHADMHPGNIFVAHGQADSPQYIAIDCAIIGSLSEFDQYYLARNLLAVFQRDYRLVAELHIECGWIPKHTKVQDFESAIRTVCEPVFQKPIGEISFGHLLISLFQTARRFDMEVQPSLVLLQKTLLNIEGLGKQLYPELNLWDTAKPQLEQWLKDRYAPKQMLKRVQRYVPGWLEQLPSLPDKFMRHLSQVDAIESLNKDQQRYIDELQQQRTSQRRQKRYSKLLILLIAAIVTSFEPDLQAALSNLSNTSIIMSLVVILIWLRS